MLSSVKERVKIKPKLAIPASASICIAAVNSPRCLAGSSGSGMKPSGNSSLMKSVEMSP